MIGKVGPSRRPVIWTSLQLGPDLTGRPLGSTFPILKHDHDDTVKDYLYLHSGQADSHSLAMQFMKFLQRKIESTVKCSPLLLKNKKAKNLTRKLDHHQIFELAVAPSTQFVYL